ncbi:MAG: FtsH protease activity modulator HflK [Candidatus Omnitrophica bacterium]|nr:FtsH protease activity modulator HflK [Candidatus Omnitrophota bacterium]MBU1047185.1 FtsH protease activity modulator HflK [Candidatus Omnitrophota bacterium]MBU1630257.1 FtsH protease activity modulator HflK [Candidatus Omnitrophota bacterium]MBU1766840.1 FtsH protease activity modulator HflK [Candidatus Omnitrophota bacterium]MBU1889485.1 FtsH protease activity modulator HflK [Candidatus Omnitrophota bacterium]
MEWKDVQGVEDAIDVGKQKFSDFGRFMPWIIMGFFVLIILMGSIYSIGPDEVGVRQRFGKYLNLSSPGLHIKIPFGIEKVTPIKVEKVFKEEFGVRTLQPGVRTSYSSKQYLEESLMLTGDLNILDVRWIVQYKVKDPVKLLFAVRDPKDNIRDVSEVVMRRLVGDYSVDEVLTTQREEIDYLAQDELQKILDDYQTGVQIITVKLLDVNPPEKVKPAFNEVNEAKQEKEKVINQAWEAYNKVIPRATGEAEKTIREAEGYALDKINRAKGEAERFLVTLGEYKKAPQITQKRLYLETMMEVLPRAKQKYIIDPKQSSILPLLNIGEQGGAKQ